MIAVAVALSLIVVLLTHVWLNMPDTSPLVPDLPIVGRPGFIGSDSCVQCHTDQYKSWHKSYHRTMTQVASPESIVPSFDDVHLEAHTRSYHLTREGDEFWADMPDPDWEEAALRKGQDLSKVQPPRKRARIVMTTGSHNMQTYWIATTDGNKLRHFPWFYSIAEQCWISDMDSLIRPPMREADILVDQLSVFWNKDCIRCHAVAGKTVGTPDYWLTSVAELGIACEACHGPAEAHVEFHRDGKVGPEPSSLINPSKCDPKVAGQICGQCHSDSDRSQMDEYHAGDDLLKTQRMYDLTTTKYQANYWPDGTQRVGGREYTAMVKSACYLKGELHCLSCHSMHKSDPNDQLAAKMESNEACLQCHDSYRNRIEEHTHHEANSSGSKCYNCHMPYTSFVLLKSIRSHRIDPPSVKSSVKYGRPNGCNSCHLDRTLAWTAKYLQEWYDIDSGEIDQEATELPASLIWLLKGDAVQRAVAADALGWDSAKHASGEHWQAAFLAQLLRDPYTAVRFVALKNLRKLPAFDHLDYGFAKDDANHEKAFQEAMKIWQEQSGIAPVPPGLKSLMNASGKLNESRIEQLIKERDDTPIYLIE